jgi:hypothetical protein
MGESLAHPRPRRPGCRRRLEEVLGHPRGGLQQAGNLPAQHRIVGADRCEQRLALLERQGLRLFEQRLGATMALRIHGPIPDRAPPAAILGRGATASSRWTPRCRASRRPPPSCSRRRIEARRSAPGEDRGPPGETNCPPAPAGRPRPRPRCPRHRAARGGRCRPLSGAASPGVIDQDPAHGLGRDGEEVPAILPEHPVLIDQAEEGLVHQGRGLERVIGALAAKLAGGDRAQLRVDERHQLVESCVASRAPGIQEAGDLTRLATAHHGSARSPDTPGGPLPAASCRTVPNDWRQPAGCRAPWPRESTRRAGGPGSWNRASTPRVLVVTLKKV